MSRKMIIPPVSEEKMEVRGDEKEFSFEWAEMYNPPDLSYKILRDLVEFFGTEKIGTSFDIEHDGCSTCNYGSRYGYTVTIEGATRNNPFIPGQVVDPPEKTNGDDDIENYIDHGGKP